ncbi:MAG: PorV/PorQ family protein [Bacteroidota bacterium]
MSVPTAMVILCAWPLTAQVTKVGTTAAKFLSIPVGARALGMGGAYVAVANDPAAMYWNAAGLAGQYQAEAMFNHANWIADIDFNYGGVVFPLGDLGMAGVNFTSLNAGEMERTTEDQPEGTGEMFTAGSFAVGISYARSLTDWFSIGANVKYVNERIWNSSATGIALDVGTLFSTPFEGLKFGAAITNFGTKMRINGDDLLVLKDISSNNGNNPNVNANLSTDYFDLPLTLRIGLSYVPIANEDEILTFAVDAVHPNDNSESISLGGEIAAFQRIVALRAGYKALGAKDGEDQFTVGGGVRYAVGGDFVVKLDYAFQKFGRLNNVHKFGVGVMF